MGREGDVAGVGVDAALPLLYLIVLHVDVVMELEWQDEGEGLRDSGKAGD